MDWLRRRRSDSSAGVDRRIDREVTVLGTKVEG
jgi:hypothetical protein